MRMVAWGVAIRGGHAARSSPGGAPFPGHALVDKRHAHPPGSLTPNELMFVDPLAWTWSCSRHGCSAVTWWAGDRWDELVAWLVGVHG